jgi:hypothetical protein
VLNLILILKSLKKELSLVKKNCICIVVSTRNQILIVIFVYNLTMLNYSVKLVTVIRELEVSRHLVLMLNMYVSMDISTEEIGEMFGVSEEEVCFS